MKVVNVKSGESYDVYCGRANKFYNLPESKWHNPFWMKNESFRDEVIIKFENYLRSRQDLLDSLYELDGKILACWCAPRKCHCDILIKVRQEQLNNKE